MEKDYFILLNQCIKISKFFEYWKYYTNMKIKMEKDPRKINRAIKKLKNSFEIQLEETEKMCEDFKNKQKDYPLINLIMDYKLDKIERTILYYVLGNNLLNRTSDLIMLMYFLTENNSNLFPEFKIKYLEENSKLFSERILFPTTKNWFYFIECKLSTNIYMEICGLTKKNPDIEIEKDETLETFPIDNFSSPEQIYSILNQWVIGQEEAKRILSVTAYRHYLCLKNPDLDIHNANILLIGPTGVGKTSLVRVLARYLKVPVLFTSANEYTKTGYVGRSINEMIIDLYEKADKDRVKAEHGIIFIDEIDKIAAVDIYNANHYSNRDIAGRSVQEELLNILETTGPHTYINDHDYLDRKKVTLDASKILFIGAGTFDRLEYIVRNRLKSSGIGFNLNHNKYQSDFDKPLSSILISDLEKYGFIPEFLGRFSNIAVLSELSNEELVRIMTEPKKSVLSEYKEYFKILGIEFNITDNALVKIAAITKELGTGARGLRSTMEKILNPFLLKIGEKNTEFSKIVIEEKHIDEMSISQKM